MLEEEIDDYKAIEAMPGVMRIPEKTPGAGNRAYRQRRYPVGGDDLDGFTILDSTGSDARNEDGLKLGANVTHQ